MKQIIIILLLLPSLSHAFPHCETGDALLPKYKAQALSINVTWMKDATYCDFGNYQIIIPNDSSIEDIIVLKNGRLFLSKTTSLGINLWQRYGSSKQLPYITVQDWDQNDTYERLDYSIIDKNGNLLGNVHDKMMNGQTKKVFFQK